MKNTIQRTVSFLAATMMATQLFGEVTTQAARTESSSVAFEQAQPATPAQKEIAELLQQIASNAAIAGRQAEDLEVSARRGHRVSYEPSAAQLTTAKEAINKIGADFERLKQLRSSALPWQQLVIDRMQPSLVGMAGHTTHAIELLNEERGIMPSQEYRDAIEGLSEHAAQTRNLIGVNLDYAEAREKLNRLDAVPAEPVTEIPTARASEQAAPTAASLAQRVRHELVMLPYYGVYDHLTFQIDGDQVTLGGYVNRPTLKTSAERVVRSLEGVATVNSTIEVLPVSSHDDRIRIAAYRAIYGHSVLARYRLNPNPPIRIIVKNGNVTLLGVVGSEMDKNIANMQANSVSGAFSVTNYLQVVS